MTETLANRLTRLLARRRRSDLSFLAGHSAGLVLRPAPVAVLPAATGPVAGSVRPLRRPGRPTLRCTVDPADEQRTLISGRMSEVCDALDRLVARQAAAATALQATQAGSL
ncbi:MAG: hypothetical protein L6Q75_13590 [Burkholderiaceae bacterium]|nr:hypothetical protein [Burkholderiaceae bacterium]